MPGHVGQLGFLSGKLGCERCQLGAGMGLKWTGQWAALKMTGNNWKQWGNRLRKDRVKAGHFRSKHTPGKSKNPSKEAAEAWDRRPSVTGLLRGRAVQELLGWDAHGTLSSQPTCTLKEPLLVLHQPHFLELPLVGSCQLHPGTCCRENVPQGLTELGCGVLWVNTLFTWHDFSGSGWK